MPRGFFLPQRLQVVHRDHDHAQHGKHRAGGPVEHHRACPVGETGGNERPHQCKQHAQHQHKNIRCAADGEVGNGAGEGGEGHDEHAGAHRGFQLVAKHTGEDEKHHQTAACAHKAADEADHHAAAQRLQAAHQRRKPGPLFLGGGHRQHDEFQAQEQCHEQREATHGLAGHQAGSPAAHHGEHQHGGHHHQPAPDVQIFVFSVGNGGSGAGQHVAGKGDAHRQVGIHVQEGDEHGADHRGGTHAGESGAQARAHPREKAYDQGQKHLVIGLTLLRKS